jgi:hypothetical protein
MKEKLLLAIAITLAIISLQDWTHPMRVRSSIQIEAFSKQIARLHFEALP